MGTALRKAFAASIALIAVTSSLALSGCDSEDLLKAPPSGGKLQPEPVDPNDPGVVGPALSTIANPTKILFEDGVSESQRKLIEFDLTQLSSGTLSVLDDQEGLKKTLGLASSDNGALLDWLEARISYIVPESFDVEARVRMEMADYPFKNPGVFPGDQLMNPVSGGSSAPAPIQAADTDPSAGSAPMADQPEVPFRIGDLSPFSEGQVKVMMSNIGAAIYMGSKERGDLYSARLDGIGQIQVTSPRTGIIQIGEGLFAEDYGTIHKKPWGLVSVINRLATFFHEARHSDGNGTSLAFAHAFCPKGHDLQGRRGCDRNLNGPYRVGAHIVRALEKSCTTCTAYEREVLTLIRADYLDRVITITKPGDLGAPAGLSSPAVSGNWDPTPEGAFQ